MTKWFNLIYPQGGYSQKNWVGVCSLLLKILIKITYLLDGYDQNLSFPYPIYDLTKNSTPYKFMAWPSVNTLFQTSLIISCLVQTYVKGNCDGLSLMILSIVMKK